MFEKFQYVAEIAKIYAKEYFNKLGIMDHVREVSFLYDHEYKYMKVSDKWEAEMADLYILLEAYFNRKDKASILEARYKRFIEKFKKDASAEALLKCPKCGVVKHYEGLCYHCSLDDEVLEEIKNNP